jgi:hypothetical protein
MIQATANQAASIVPPKVGLPVAQAEDGGNPVDFASVLAGNMPAEADKAPVDTPRIEAPVPATPKAVLQLAGKTPGKGLPLSLPTGLPLPDEASDPADDAPLDPQDPAAAGDNPAVVLAAIAVPIAILAQMQDVQQSAASQPKPDRFGNSPVAPEASQLVASTPPGAAEKTPALLTLAEAITAGATLTESRPASRRTAMDPPATRVAAVTSPQAPSTLTSTDPLPAMDTTAPAQPGTHKRELHLAAARTIEDANPAAPVTATAATAITAESLSDTPVAAELQPMLAIRDAQPVVATNPQTVPAASTQQSGHDFAALIDRLVEARESSAPQTVQAAISHADFGQVSLRFDHDGNGLTVAMTSADPDFAPAVQAAAASSQAGNDNLSQSRQDGASRHDGQALNSGSTFAGQQQSQSTPRTTSTDPRTAGTGRDTHGDDHETTHRDDGIYA